MADKKKIVMIDDDENACFLAKAMIEQTGKYEVVTSTDPLDAERLCQQEKPDLILLDVVMPKRKGSEVAKSLKRDATTKDIPIIIVSGSGEMVYKKGFFGKFKWQWLPGLSVAKERGTLVDTRYPEKAAKAYGVESFLSKPFYKESLLEEIEYFLKKRDEALEKKKGFDSDESPEN